MNRSASRVLSGTTTSDYDLTCRSFGFVSCVVCSKHEEHGEILTRKCGYVFCAYVIPVMSWALASTVFSIACYQDCRRIDLSVFTFRHSVKNCRRWLGIRQPWRTTLRVCACHRRRAVFNRVTRFSDCRIAVWSASGWIAVHRLESTLVRHRVTVLCKPLWGYTFRVLDFETVNQRVLDKQSTNTNVPAKLIGHNGPPGYFHDQNDYGCCVYVHFFLSAFSALRIRVRGCLPMPF